MDPLSQILTDLFQRIVDHPAESLTPESFSFAQKHGRLPSKQDVQVG